MKRLLALAVAAATIATPVVASAQGQRTVTTAEKQRLIAEAKEHNRQQAERDKQFYASQDRLTEQLEKARANNDTARIAQLQKQVRANGDQRERQKARNAAYQQHIKEVYALKTSD